jgi:hypothetical protein
MTVVIEVAPSRNPDGSRAYSTRGQLFDATIDSRLIVTRSTQPLLDGCRVLIAEGVDPATRIVMRHAGSEIDALRSTVGAAARLMVGEGERAPIFRRWEASPLARGTLPVRRDDLPVDMPPPNLERPG